MPTVLITGANRGIGLALAQQLTARGDRVIGACRSGSPALDAIGVPSLPLDLAEPASIAAFPQALAKVLGDGRVDVLLHNAGVLQRNPLDGLDLDSVQRQFAVNALGPLALTAALRARLQTGAKVVFVTSRMGSIADNSTGSHYGYRMSKAALNAAGKSLAIDLKPAGVAVVLLHPGYVRTGMTGGHGELTPEQSAAGLIARIDALSLASTGQFLHMNGEPLPW